MRLPIDAHPPNSQNKDEYDFDNNSISSASWTRTQDIYYSVEHQMPIKQENDDDNDSDKPQNTPHRSSDDHNSSELENTPWTDVLERSANLIREFAEKVPGMEQLDRDDFELLFRSSLFELFSLIFAFQNKSNLEDGNMIELKLNCGIVLHRNQIFEAFDSWLENIENLMQNLNAYRVDSRAISCLCALALVNLRNGVRNNNKIEDIQSTLLSSLRDYCDYHSKDRNLFSKLIALLTNAKSLSIDILKRLDTKIGIYGCGATASETDQSVNDDQDHQLVQNQQEYNDDDDVSGVLDDITDGYDMLFE